MSDVCDAEAGEDLVSALQAATILGVKPNTIYTYVTRSSLHPIRRPGDRRSWFLRAEVNRLASGERGVPRTPLQSTEARPLAEIVDDHLCYRGQDAAELARTVPFEDVAELLWQPEPHGSEPWGYDQDTAEMIARVQSAMPPGSFPIDRIKATLTVLGASDSLRYDLSPHSVIAAGRRSIPAMVSSLEAVDLPATEPRRLSIAEQLWLRLTSSLPSDDYLRLMSATLVMLADHGLPSSTSVVRELAKVATDPYSILLAGTAMASGRLLGGGSSRAVYGWLKDIETPGSVASVLGDRLLRGERIYGFGQPRYENSDPRANLILELLQTASSPTRKWEIIQTAVDLVYSRRRLNPNVEFALAAVCFVNDMPGGAGEAIFAIARSAGWLAHAIREYDQDLYL
jgi:citrate synthase